VPVVALYKRRRRRVDPMPPSSHSSWVVPCLVSRSVRPRRVSSPVRRAEPSPFLSSSLPSFPSWSSSPPSGPQWLHEIKLDGFRMAARIDNGRVQLLTRTGLDWTGKYPSAAAALANLNVKTAYIDGELCGVDDGGLPSFAQTQAATDGERNVHLVYLRVRSFALGRLGRLATSTHRAQGAA
jgi:ATP-dependent DNA ligase